tara:strand:- start:841 stop:1197 length:357 start_codon:yes stop_codon:yes gene_type:complete
MAGISSVNSSCTFGGTISSNLTSLSVSGRGFSTIDQTSLQEGYKRQLKGQRGNATISVTTLDNPGWSLGGSGGELTIVAGTEAYALKTCVLTEKSVDIGMDASVEFSWTFEQVDGETV